MLSLFCSHSSPLPSIQFYLCYSEIYIDVFSHIFIHTRIHNSIHGTYKTKQHTHACVYAVYSHMSMSARRRLYLSLWLLMFLFLLKQTGWMDGRNAVVTTNIALWLWRRRRRWQQQQQQQHQTKRWRRCTTTRILCIQYTHSYGWVDMSVLLLV